MEAGSITTFVVDRKDPDYRTIREYNTYAEGINAVTNPHSRQQIDDQFVLIIVTTIQKLAGTFVTSHHGTPSIPGTLSSSSMNVKYRSQFGDMHTDISAFRNVVSSGFTGTPIFAENASSSGKKQTYVPPSRPRDQLHPANDQCFISWDKTVLCRLPELFRASRRTITTTLAHRYRQRLHEPACNTAIRFLSRPKDEAARLFPVQETSVSGFNSCLLPPPSRARAHYQELNANRPTHRRHGSSVGIIYLTRPTLAALASPK